MTTNLTLASIDAGLSAVSLGYVAAGYVAVKRKQIEIHRRRMIVAFAASAAFLVIFVIRFATFGFQPFTPTGIGRAAYLVVLFSHEPLAVINVPLVVAALILGLRRADRAHREVAPIALWIWSYVLVTGIAIFFALYLLS